ncbi:MFS transporter [Nonomuraea sp. KC401]|uniref:MFS transporter n=1 Tax=unclassified Nonomuraea TaxID=2593643 RepID=UPI0010FD47FF|nr:MULTISPECIES: MFS transporter [unclassified Nonomuraea]NBE96357.1 MFS transporter [Nonomuraea sp. K271]TLF68721.1 MFS transporter [Nonomuraea sp. KC401]
MSAADRSPATGGSGESPATSDPATEPEPPSGESPPPAPRREDVPLRRQRDYRLLWTARTISITGSEVSKLAIPLTAVTLLAASPAQMGLLTSAAFVPALLFGLQSGAIADRLPRHRPLMIVCELVSCAAAVTVPVAWLLGLLNVPWLIFVALVIGTAGVFFRAANFPHLAAVVPPEQRTEAMAGLQASYSVASVSGPGLAGLLVQMLTAPLAVLAEALSFLASVLLLRSIRTPERNEPAASRGMWRDVMEGLKVSITHPVLRALLGAGVTINFFAMAFTAVYMLYMVNTLGIPKGLIGVLIALSGAGGLLGAWLTARLSKRYGENRILFAAALFFPSEILAVGLLTGPLWWKLSVLAVTGTLTGAIVVAFATCMGAITLRDTTAELRGRVNATMTFAVQGVLALGGLVGGLLAEVIGLRSVILICAAGIALSTLWIWTSPLRPRRTKFRAAGEPGADPTLTPSLNDLRDSKPQF